MSSEKIKQQNDSNDALRELSFELRHLSTLRRNGGETDADSSLLALPELKLTGVVAFFTTYQSDLDYTTDLTFSIDDAFGQNVASGYQANVMARNGQASPNYGMMLNSEVFLEQVFDMTFSVSMGTGAGTVSWMYQPTVMMFFDYGPRMDKLFKIDVIRKGQTHVFPL